MWIQTRPCSFWAVLNLLLLIASTNVKTINGLSSKKFDESPSGDPSVKCSPCMQYPPPSPPPPPPPSPALPPPSPKKHPSTYCPPPPPPSSFIYMLGPPGNLYPIDQNFNDASQNKVMELSIFLLFRLLGLIALW